MSSRGGTAGIILVYLLATAFISWPLALHLDGFLLSRGYKDVYHSDAFQYINHMTDSGRLFYSNVLINFNRPPADICVSCDYFGLALISFGLEPVAAYNLLFLLSVFLSGLFAHLLMLELSGDWLASFFCGFSYMSSNYVFSEYIWGHANLWQIQWLPLVFLLVERVLERKGFRYSILLGLALALQVYSSTQYSVYLSFVMPLYVVLRVSLYGRSVLKDKYVLAGISLSVVVALMASGFYAVERISLLNPVRTLEENMMKYWRMDSFKQLFDAGSNIHLGVVQSLLILPGLYVLLSDFRTGSYRRYYPFSILLIPLVFCMLGPFGSLAPYYWLYRFWPFVDNFRVPVRLFPFVLMCSSILSSLFLAHMKKRGWGDRYRLAAAAVALSCIVAGQFMASPFLSSHHIFHT